MRKSKNIVFENEDYLTTQIITYIGNKRSLLSFIGEAVNIVKKNLHKDKLEIVDLFQVLVLYLDI